MEVVASFLEDWRQILIERLRALGCKAPPPTADVRSVEKQYFRFWRRRIPIRSREVHFSDAYQRPEARAASLRRLEDKMRAGGDLNPHLSTAIDRPWFDDKLLDDWDIQPFHLGDRLERTGFVTRTPELLFAHVTPGAVHLIDVRDHQRFVARELLEILARNWPESVEDHRLKKVVGLPVQLSDEGIAMLRRAGISPVVQGPQVGALAPLGAGLALDGTGVDVVTTARWFESLIQRCEQAALGRADELVQGAASRGVALQPPIVLRLEIMDEELWASEEQGGGRLLLGRIA